MATGPKRNNQSTQSGVVDFPNPSRSYDELAGGIHFWGYDQALEISFFIEKSALLKVAPDACPDESGLLLVFDVHHARIHAVADELYSQRNKALHSFAYTLKDCDF